MSIKKNSSGKNIKKSLILAGGGMRLAYQAGVLIALKEQGISFDHIDGTSGGIFNAGMLASGLTPDEIADRWRKLKMKNFMSFRPLKNYFNPLNMKAYADADGIRNKVFTDLGIDIKKINQHQTPEITFNVCNFSEKTVEAIHHKEVQIDHLIAGVSLPIVMPGLKINDQWYSDAVWIKDANLIEAVKRGSEEIHLAWVIGNTSEYLPGALNQYVHMIEMSANGALLEEYARIDLINKQISEGKSEFVQSNPIKLFVIKPRVPLPLDPDLFFNKIDARSLINMGYSDTKNSPSMMSKNGVKLDKYATKMSDPGIRLNLRSAFHGHLSNDEDIFKASFYTYLVFSDYSDHKVIDMYSSIYINFLKKEIPCYDHEVKTSNIKGKQIFSYKGNFTFQKSSYTIQASWEIGSVVDLMIGIALKSVKISISEHENAMELHGTLYQNIKQRLKSIYTTNVRQPDGTSGGIRKKYKMFSNLYNYEI